MESKELRIGNWVCSDKGLPSETNFVITASDILDIDEQAVVIEPIKLTEEWLVKLGFEFYRKEIFRKSFKTGRKKMWQIFLFKDGSYYQLRFENSIQSDIGIMIDFKNVHQLQNLYFSLTGNELILTD